MHRQQLRRRQSRSTADSDSSPSSHRHFRVHPALLSLQLPEYRFTVLRRLFRVLRGSANWNRDFRDFGLYEALFALGCGAGLYWLAILGRGGRRVTGSGSAHPRLKVVSGLALALTSYPNPHDDSGLFKCHGEQHRLHDFPLWFASYCVCFRSLLSIIRDHTLGIKDKLLRNESKYPS